MVFLKVIHVDKEAVIANDQVLCVVAVETFHFMNIMQCIQLPILARKGIFLVRIFVISNNTVVADILVLFSWCTLQVPVEFTLRRRISGSQGMCIFNFTGQ